MQGILNKEPLPEVLRAITGERESGVLHLNREQIEKRIYFGRGSMLFARSDLQADRLGEFLVRNERMSRHHLVDASNKMRASGKRLGETLVSMGLMTEAEMHGSVAEQVTGIIYSLFGWREGQFCFRQLSNPVNQDIALDLHTVPVILEGVRRITDPVTVRGALGDLQRVVSYSRDPWVHSHQVSLTPDEGFVLSRVDGQISMADILSLSPLGEDETLRCLYGLVSSGFLEFGPKTREVTPSRKSKRFYDMGNVERGRARPEKPSISKPPVNHEEQWVREDIEEKHASLAAGNYYDWLEVRRRASAADLKKAYSYLIKKYHPDRHRAKVLEDLSPALQEIITKVREAYESLSEPLTRRRYDNSLRTEAPRGEVNSRPAALERPAEPPAPDPAEKRAEHYYQEARRHFENQDYHATVRLLEEAVELVPSNGAYHRLLGQALAKNPKWRRNAEKHFKIALRLDPVDIQALIFLGGLYQSVGMKSRAKAIFAGVQGRPGQLGNPQPPRRSGEGDPVPLVVVALGRIAIAKQLGPGQGSGTQPFYLENVENFRSENVTILDLRFEKTFRLSGRNRLTTMLDIYNATNDNPETNFVLRTGRNFKNIIAALHPRTFTVGDRR